MLVTGKLEIPPAPRPRFQVGEKVYFVGEHPCDIRRRDPLSVDAAEVLAVSMAFLHEPDPEILAQGEGWRVAYRIKAEGASGWGWVNERSLCSAEDEARHALVSQWRAARDAEVERLTALEPPRILGPSDRGAEVSHG